MIHPRTAIRAYAWEMLKEEMDVGGRVFLNRPNPYIIKELPAACLYFTTGISLLSEGDRYIPQAYERQLNLTVDVMAEAPTDPNGDIRVEAELDNLSRQAERAFGNDVFFMRRLSGFDDTWTSEDGLIAGSAQIDEEMGLMEIGDRLLSGQTTTFQIKYFDTCFEPERSKYFEYYSILINKMGWNEQTVDPTLIGAEGTI